MLYRKKEPTSVESSEGSGALFDRLEVFDPPRLDTGLLRIAAMR